MENGWNKDVTWMENGLDNGWNMDGKLENVHRKVRLKSRELKGIQGKDCK